MSISGTLGPEYQCLRVVAQTPVRVADQSRDLLHGALHCELGGGNIALRMPTSMALTWGGTIH
jgi:hypothetical protein